MGRGSRGGAIATILGALLNSMAFSGPTSAAAESIRCQGERATVVGSPGPDRLRGTSGRDVIAGLGGADSITARGGSDLVCGGAGKDEIFADLTRDRIHGGRGSDTIDYQQWLLEPVRVDLALGSATGPSGRDHLKSLENVTGTVYPDVLLGSAAENVLYGFWDDDVIKGRGGDDVINGGENDDDDDVPFAQESLWGGSGDDLIEFGYFGQGTAYGGSGDDRIDGEGELRGGPGRDNLYGGPASSLFGGAGGDSLTVWPSTEREGWTEDGGRGLDYCDAISGEGIASCEKDLHTQGCWHERPTIVGTNRSETIQGTPNDDVIVARRGNDIVAGGDGDDRICTGGGGDVVTGGAGDDSVDAGRGADRVNGAAGIDALWGGGDADHLIGSSGGDFMEGGSGPDVILGRAGSDWLAGSLTVSCWEDAVCNGLSSNGDSDELGYPADDGNVVEGGRGNDQIFGSAGDDRLSGGPGNNDGLDLSGAGGQVKVDLAAGRASGVAGRDRLDGIEAVLAPRDYPATLIGDEHVNTLIGGVPPNQILGGGGDDYIAPSVGNPHPTIWEPEWDSMVELARGGDGNDTLQGSPWMDELYGERGDDIIRAGDGGPDVIDGGSGIDVCSLSSDGGEKRNCEET